LDFVDSTDSTVPAWAKEPNKPTYTASEVGADPKGTASNLVSAHNTASNTHSDIREQISQLSVDKADKSAMTLGVHTDGFVYLFINGVPQGNGLDIKADVIEGDVFGYVDENNVIVLNGALAEGTYTIKYEMDDGSTVEIGDLVLDNNVYYSITNNLTNCTNSNNTVQMVEGGSYSATISANSGYELSSVKVTMGGTDISSTAVSGGKVTIANVTGNIVITAVATEVATTPKGNLADPTSADWQEGYRLSISAGTTSALAGHTTTNYIPAKVGDVLRVKGLKITGYDSNSTDAKYAAKIAAFNVNKTKLGGAYGLDNSGSKDAYGLQVTVEGDVSEYTLMLKNDGSQTSASIAYIRIDGFLMDGYTKEDVVITINEEISDTEGSSYYSVTNTLTNCTTSNSATQAAQGGSYSTTITAKSGYELSSVKVTMGGTDISSTAVSGGTITIANVTGNIVITAVAEEKVVTPSYTNFADPTSADWKTGVRLTTDINQTTTLAGGIATNYIATQNGDIVTVKGINFDDSNNRIAHDDGANGEDISGIGKASVYATTHTTNGYFKDVTYDSNSVTLTVTCTTTQMRFSGLATGTSDDVVINIKRNGVWL
jgi:hypothetical protein